VQTFFFGSFVLLVPPAFLVLLTYAPNQICCHSTRFYYFPYYSFQFALETGSEPLQLRLFEQV